MVGLGVGGREAHLGAGRGARRPRVEGERGRWLPDAPLHERTATRPRSARFDWDGGETRVHVTFADKGDGRATAVVSHERLPDAEAAERMKAFWRGRIATLKEVLEG